jgi:hypothetical protein
MSGQPHVHREASAWAARGGHRPAVQSDPLPHADRAVADPVGTPGAVTAPVGGHLDFDRVG